MPRLSVCIPTWNGARHLRPCLDSVLAQTFVDLEVIVGDDASTDDTLDVVRSLPDPRVRVLAFAERAGLAGNWNRTWAAATGDYAALVGQDDRLDPRWAARLVGLLERHRDADLAFGRRRFEFSDEQSRAALGDFFERRYPEMLAPFHARIGEVIPPAVMVEEAMRFRFEINLIGEPSFVVVRRTAAAARGFDPDMRQMIDWEFFTRFFVDRPVVHCAEEVGTYHIHAGASSLENAPLSRHYKEYVHLLDVVRPRFAGVLSPVQEEALAARHEEARELQQEWTRKEADA